MTVNAASVGTTYKLYRNTGTVASPSWTELAEIGDVAISELSRGLAELKRRSKAYVKNIPTLIQSIGIEARFIHNSGGSAARTLLTNLRTAFFAGTVFEIAVADDAIASTGTQALRIQVVIEQFPWDQPLEDIAGHDIRFVTAYMVESDTEADPSWMVV